MKFPGKLEAGLKSGVLTESKYIKGTYIVFQDYDDMYELSFKNSDCECEKLPIESVLVEGTKCFLVSNTNPNPEIVSKYPGNAEYRWTLIQETGKYDWVILDAPLDGAVYGMSNGKWVEVSSDPEYFNRIVEELRQELDTKQPNLIDGKNIKTFYGKSLLIKNTGDEDPESIDLKVPVATTELIGGLKSGEDVEETSGGEYVTYQVSIDPQTEIGSVKIPPLASTATAQEIITILQQGSELTLNGGGASLSEEKS